MDKTQQALQERYKETHPLLFQRSLEKSTSNGNLFDILEGIPEFPVIWDENTRSWVTTDLVQSKDKTIEAK
jgi:hypothetical protein